MKRMLYLLVVLMLFSAAAHAQEELRWLSPTIGGNDAVMIVDNGDDWTTRLNLRSEQSKESEIKGRIYTGTRVEVYQDNGEWCTVGLNLEGGSILTGDVMKRYLTPIGKDYSALCPLAVAKEEIEVINGIDLSVAQLRPGDEAYVLAVCGKQYFLMIPGVGQGYAPVDAFEALTEPPEEKRIVYRSFCVPEGGLSFEDEMTGEKVFLAGGVLLEDCWQIAGEDVWHITFGAGIQRTPRVLGVIPAEKLVSGVWMPFEGEAYALNRSFILCVGTVAGEPILQRVDQNGDIFWALGNVPDGASQFDSDLCVIYCETEELLSQAVINNIMEYVDNRRPLDERGGDSAVSDEVIARCTLRASLIYDTSAKELIVRTWLEDVDGTYVTGGDLDPRTGEIVRWGCNG